MTNFLLPLICLVSLIAVACGGIVCEGSTGTIPSCGTGLTAKFSKAWFTRKDSGNSSPWCRTCCFINDRSNTGADNDIWHTSAYYASGVYRNCYTTLDVANALTAHCLIQKWSNIDSCLFTASVDFFNQISSNHPGDPCPGIYKYFEYEYSCLDQDDVYNYLVKI